MLQFATKPMMQRRDTFIDGVRLAYLEHGAARVGSPSLLLFHGLIANAESFSMLAACLSGYHIVALDMPGSGESDHVGVEPDFASLARITRAFADAVGLHRPVLIGHSHGGAIALRIAVTDPAWAEGLVLLCPAHPFSGTEEQLVRFYLSSPGRLFARNIPKLPRWVHRTAFHWMPGRRLQLGDEQLEPYLETLRTPRTIAYTLRLLESWKQDMQTLGAELELDSLNTPTLLLWGERDLVVPRKTAAGLLQHLSHAKLVTLKGVGHLPNDEAPEECARLIAAWLANVAPATTASAQTQPAPRS